jgi:hypothetical protein
LLSWSVVAVGHSILGISYTDLGGDYFDKRRTSTAHQRRLIAQLEAMGHDVTLPR